MGIGYIEEKCWQVVSSLAESPLDLRGRLETVAEIFGRIDHPDELASLPEDLAERYRALADRFNARGSYKESLVALTEDALIELARDVVEFGHLVALEIQDRLRQGLPE